LAALIEFGKQAIQKITAQFFLSRER